MVSFTEENYIKAIYHLSDQKSGAMVSTNELAEITQTRAASITDMLKKLSDKKYIHYKKYQGVKLTDSGEEIALHIIRKHRLWEVFLVEKLGFKWDEIHDLAEQLEHIKSADLTNRLDIFLGHPRFDPHGDPIPDASGKMPVTQTIRLSEAVIGQNYVIMGVSEDSSPFLQHLDRLGIKLGLMLQINDRSDFDQSLELSAEGHKTIRVSIEVARNIQVLVR